MINRMIRENDLVSVIELGCGDGNQLTLADYPEYLGLDVSPTATRRCIELHGDDATKAFMLYSAEHFSDRRPGLSGDVTLSLEVIFHLVEDVIFEQYMAMLFAMAARQVIICASDRDDLPEAPQERHRVFTRWVADNARGGSSPNRSSRPTASMPGSRYVRIPD